MSRISPDGIAKYLSNGGTYKVKVRGENQRTFQIKGYGSRVSFLGIPLWRSTYDVAQLLLVPNKRSEGGHLNLSHKNGHSEDRSNVSERVKGLARKLSQRFGDYEIRETN